MTADKYLLEELDGKPVYACDLVSENTYVRIITYGGRISDLIFCDTPIVCGFSCVADYRASGDYHGALVGRCASRIADGKFTLNGKEYTLAKNEKNRTHLHGGDIGYSDRLWEVEDMFATEKEAGVVLSLFSPDGEEGYPGNVKITVTYTLTSSDAFKIEYKATTDADTPINLTNHAYFNVNGIGNTIDDLYLYINSDKYLPVDEKTITTGEIASVEGTPFDFRIAKEVGRDMYGDHPQLKIVGGGYDHGFILGEATNRPQITLSSEKTGITMNVYTDARTVQLYAGIFMNKPVNFNGDIPQSPREALCLECAGMPDTMNHPNFDEYGSMILKAGETYTQNTTYAFIKK